MTLSHWLITSFAVFSLGLLAHAQAANQWVDISTNLVEKLVADGKKPVWPGQSAGISVDRTTGAVFLIIPGEGLFKSTDHAATFTRCDAGKVTGRCETAFSHNLDPNSSRLACFQLDGKCGLSLDGGQTWSPMKDQGRNWDYAAVDWSKDKPQTIFAMLHESGGQLMLSTDAGQSWTKSDKDEKYTALGVADENTLLATKGDGLLRSTDLGKTWTKVSEFTPVTHVMQTFKGVHYFFAQESQTKLAEKAKTYPSFLLISKDKGATWAKQGTQVDAAWGPYFGKDEKHVITLGRQGTIQESTDAGETWKQVTALPPGKEWTTGRPGWFVNLAYDPTSDTFYTSRMGMPAYKFERKN